MATSHKEHNKSPTHLKMSREQILQAENKHTNEFIQRGEEKEADSTKAKAPCVKDVSQETQEIGKNSKVDDKQKKNVSEADKAHSTKDTAMSASTQAPQVPAEAKPPERGEGVGEDQAYSINTDAVLVSTQALVHFDLGTPAFNQVHDPEPGKSPSTNKDDTEEDEGTNESMSTNKDDAVQKDESNSEDIHSSRASDYSLGKTSNALTCMSVTAVAGAEKKSDVATASLLKVFDEHISTDAVTLTHQNFDAEGYGPEDEEEDLNPASALVSDLLKQSSDLS
jgi:hypothetical protein